MNSKSFLKIVTCALASQSSLSFSIGGNGNSHTQHLSQQQLSVRTATSTTTTTLEAATALNLPAAGGAEPIADAPQEEQPSIGVLLLNLGGPETGDDVEGVYVLCAVSCFDGCVLLRFFSNLLAHSCVANLIIESNSLLHRILI